MPKFLLYSGHQETLFPLFNALGKYRVSKVPTGGAIFFEFIDGGDLGDLVKVIYKRDAQSEETIWIDKYSDSKLEGAIPIDRFGDFIDERLAETGV